eukprot:Blabericola_migrator_1__9367@NODE_504_length_7967_cov_171_363291_g386_i0_p1_GENE_NODE_504_length_7967_cov_171_363291_g386_i0NODE_504_length_7967_cov_171_363291_g386_i0_p1_ORF_typecomplete_len861_score124_08HAUS5/PF14817_6/0_00073MukF_M/PF17192_4/0_16TACC_C/PF05010_14/0_224HB_MCP_1/PF12729_7/0_43Leu_zip/PF15294_6/2_3SYCE1/PF15233_6/3_1Trimer_CC/PF08954_11/5_4e02Trimer_CC/PF08954_11/10_NODE_504_length_7967_cov_171_363291_g386_i053357917
MSQPPESPVVVPRETMLSSLPQGGASVPLRERSGEPFRIPTTNEEAVRGQSGISSATMPQAILQPAGLMNVPYTPVANSPTAQQVPLMPMTSMLGGPLSSNAANKTMYQVVQTYYSEGGGVNSSVNVMSNREQQGIHTDRQDTHRQETLTDRLITQPDRISTLPLDSIPQYRAGEHSPSHHASRIESQLMSSVTYPPMGTIVCWPELVTNSSSGPFAELPKMEDTDIIVEVEIHKEEPYAKFVPDPRNPYVIPKPEKSYKAIAIKERAVPQLVPRPVSQVHEKPIRILQARDREVPTIVAQIYQGSVRDDLYAEREIACKEYVPQLIEVTVPIPKYVSGALLQAGSVTTVHEQTTITAAHWNSLVKVLNPVTRSEIMPYMTDIRSGNIPFLNEPVEIVTPQSDEWKSTRWSHVVIPDGYTMKALQTLADELNASRREQGAQEIREANASVQGLKAEIEATRLSEITRMVAEYHRVRDEVAALLAQRDTSSTGKYAAVLNERATKLRELNLTEQELQKRLREQSQGHYHTPQTFESLASSFQSTSIGRVDGAPNVVINQPSGAIYTSSQFSSTQVPATSSSYPATQPPSTFTSAARALQSSSGYQSASAVQTAGTYLTSPVIQPTYSGNSVGVTSSPQLSTTLQALGTGMQTSYQSSSGGQSTGAYLASPFLQASRQSSPGQTLSSYSAQTGLQTFEGGSATQLPGVYLAGSTLGTSGSTLQTIGSSVQSTGALTQQITGGQITGASTLQNIGGGTLQSLGGTSFTTTGAIPTTTSYESASLAAQASTQQLSTPPQLETSYQSSGLHQIGVVQGGTTREVSQSHTETHTSGTRPNLGLMAGAYKSEQAFPGTMRPGVLPNL